MSHDLLIHAVVEKNERACILSRRFIDDDDDDEKEDEEEEEEALNQIVISFRESHNSASHLSLHTIEIDWSKAKKTRKINRLLSFLLRAYGCDKTRRITLEIYVHQWSIPIGDTNHLEIENSRGSGRGWPVFTLVEAHLSSPSRWDGRKRKEEEAEDKTIMINCCQH